MLQIKWNKDQGIGHILKRNLTILIPPLPQLVVHRPHPPHPAQHVA